MYRCLLSRCLLFNSHLLCKHVRLLSTLVISMRTSWPLFVRKDISCSGWDCTTHNHQLQVVRDVGIPPYTQEGRFLGEYHIDCTENDRTIFTERSAYILLDWQERVEQSPLLKVCRTASPSRTYEQSRGRGFPGYNPTVRLTWTKKGSQTLCTVKTRSPI